MFPAAGAICGGANGLIYIIEGDLEGVAFSAIAFIPVIGQVSTPAKYLDDAAELTFKYGDDAAEILWNADDAYVLAMKYGDDSLEALLKESEASGNLLHYKDEILSFSELMSITEADRYLKYFTQDAIIQPKYITDSPLKGRIAPGTNVLKGIHYNKGLKRDEPWVAYYDEFGRLLARTDYNAGNIVENIDDIHFHIYQHINGSNQEVLKHVVGEYNYATHGNMWN